MNRDFPRLLVGHMKAMPERMRKAEVLLKP